MLRLVINLNRSKSRWKSIQQQFEKLNLVIQRIEAIDAQTATLPRDKVAPQGHPKKYYFPRKLSDGEVACYLSHMKCWETLLESGEQWAAIFEDDALLSPRAKSFLGLADWIPCNIHVLQLHTYEEHWKCRTTKKAFPLADGSALYTVIKPSYGTCCYLIDRQAAEKALELSSLLAAPIDEFLFNFKSPFAQLYPTRRLNPACVLHNPSTPSVIGPERFSKKQPYSFRNHLSPKRLYLSAKKKFLNVFSCKNTFFTWE